MVILVRPVPLPRFFLCGRDEASRGLLPWEHAMVLKRFAGFEIVSRNEILKCRRKLMLSPIDCWSGCTGTGCDP